MTEWSIQVTDAKAAMAVYCGKETLCAECERGSCKERMVAATWIGDWHIQRGFGALVTQASWMMDHLISLVRCQFATFAILG